MASATTTSAPRLDGRIRLPQESHSEASTLLRRLILAIGLAALVSLVAYLGRSGYRDSAGGEIGLLDAIYYATVSITTTGYGDIVPISDDARVATILVVTPARVLFLILLVGTTLELLAERTRYSLRVRRWRSRVKDHVIVCGYGTKGQSAVEALLAKGTPVESIVVIDEHQAALSAAEEAGVAAVAGNATSAGTLEAAQIDRAASVIVAPDRDDTAVLITLTARELAPHASVVAAARETANVHLLKQSGADSVITSSSAAGRLLGLATDTPRVVEVLEDLLSVGAGLDLVEHEVGPGGPPDRANGDLLVAIVRDDDVLPFDDPRVRELQHGDRMLCLRSNRKGAD